VHLDLLALNGRGRKEHGEQNNSQHGNSSEHGNRLLAATSSPKKDGRRRDVSIIIEIDQ
jgi:hypothetical protein